MPVVVHIKAAESEALARQRHQNNRNNDPFKDLFGSDLFFGNPFNSPNQIKQGTGSGVIISEDGYIVTNNHVIEFADEVEVTLFDNRQFQATIVGTDPKTDMAVLKIEAENLPVLKYADSNKAKVGQWVLAVGNPLELTSTVTAGIISAKGRDINIISGQDAIEAFIQTDAAVNPGNSGGALVDAQGNLLGINTAIATRTGYFSGYSFAIPVNIMKKIVDDIIEFGSYQRGYLGITIMDLDGDLSEELNLNISQGVVIQNVMEGSAAQYAGLLPNDVIVRIDDQEVKSSPELQEIVGSAKVGETLNLTVNRNGESKEFPVRLKTGNY
jgi:serine protease Do